MNLLEMRTEVRDRLGETTANFWKDSFINNAVNEGRRRFCNEEKWEWLFTTQSGVTVAKGANTVELIDEVVVNRHFGIILTKTGDDRLYLPEKVHPQKGLELRGRYAATQGAPEWWYTTGSITNDYGSGDIAVAQIVKLVPTPEATYNVEYNFIRRPKKLALDTDEDTDIPEDYQDAAIAWATGVCWQKEIDMSPRKADEQFAIYADVLRQARSHHNETGVDRTVVWGKDAPEPYGRDTSWPPRAPRLTDL